MNRRHLQIRIGLVLASASVASAQTAQLRYFVDGTVPGARWGDCLSSAADLDGDGLVDFVVGARRGCSAQDYVTAIRGADGGVLWNRLHTGSNCDHFGTVELIGDLDGDGISDMVVGAPQANGNRGQAHIISTQTLTTLHVLSAAGTAPDDRFGSSTGRLGDITGDGIPEFTVTASSADPCCGHYVGTTQAFDGATFAPIWQANGSAGYDYSYQKIGKDLDGDGVREVTWHSGQDGFSPQGPGYIRLLDGATGSELFRLGGVNVEDHFGDQWCLLDDVNGDGVFDIALAVPFGDSFGTNQGEIQVRSGADFAILHVTPLLAGTRTTGIGGESGGSICELPDLDGDGAPEFAVGQIRARQTAGDPATEFGAVTIVSGADGTVLEVLWGEATDDRFGTQVRMAENLSGPGRQSLVVSAPSHSSEAGRVYVYDLTPPDCNGNGVSDPDDISSGTSTDCNANGIPDECEIASGLDADCNGNGILDSCDLASGAATDCDADGILDGCQIIADGTLDLDLNGVLDVCDAIGSNYCSPAIANSTGAPAEILALGSEVLASSDVTLVVRSLPSNTFAMFVTSQTQGYAFPIPGSQGALCVVGFPGRFDRPGQVRPSGSSGSLMFSLDLSSLPTPTGFTAALPGQTWNFQAWYRDVNPTVTSNFTDAVSVTFQ